MKQRDAQVQKLTADLAKRNAVFNQAESVGKELRQLYPEITKMIIGEGVEISSDGPSQPLLYLNLNTRKALSGDAQKRITDWIKIRMGKESVEIRFDSEQALKPLSPDRSIRRGKS